MKRQWPRGATAAAAGTALPLSLYSACCLTLLLRNGCRKLKNLPVFAGVAAAVAVAVFRVAFCIFLFFFLGLSGKAPKNCPPHAHPLFSLVSCAALVSAAKHLACLSFTPLFPALFPYPSLSFSIFPFTLMIYAALLLIDLKLKLNLKLN